MTVFVHRLQVIANITNAESQTDALNGQCFHILRSPANPLDQAFASVYESFISVRDTILPVFVS